MRIPHAERDRAGQRVAAHAADHDGDGVAGARERNVVVHDRSVRDASIRDHRGSLEPQILLFTVFAANGMGHIVEGLSARAGPQVAEC